MRAFINNVRNTTTASEIKKNRHYNTQCTLPEKHINPRSDTPLAEVFPHNASQLTQKHTTTQDHSRLHYITTRCRQQSYILTAINDTSSGNTRTCNSCRSADDPKETVQDSAIHKLHIM